ncbi:hypothetical protein BV898_19207 [Hypsibius exemplaris]|uniref:Uroporphyrinogen decarboxylase (URO-D) domain-containing protein n=1 Tax=Hypsibius exemplaris TaxID=2072580 RepID=A0A9X6RNV3_HYPEX|nr:hypothetical protein BV898_19207 [Hypsibius exemplaris]
MDCRCVPLSHAGVQKNKREASGKKAIIIATSYTVEGGGSRTQAKAKRGLFVYPDATRKLLSMLARAICDFLVAQVDVAAQMLQVSRDVI